MAGGIIFSFRNLPQHGVLLYAIPTQSPSDFNRFYLLIGRQYIASPTKNKGAIRSLSNFRL
ncbi:protein of unknown function [Hyphomicrobium sp. MC1]|nr:protein of unknown function [Hyphomicrobium sp. MC1]